MKAQRIVSVLPSATEIVHALGHGKQLVGRSAECDFPPEVVSLPVVMRPRTFDVDRPSREIDHRVRKARERGESLYELDLDLQAKLRPDLLLTQALCGVCSVTEDEVREACARARVSPYVLSLQPRRLEEVWSSIDEVARALGDRASGEALLARIRSEIRPPSSRPKLRTVAVVEWLDPPIRAGLWTPDILRAAGGIPVGPPPGEPGERTTWEALAREAIDLLVLSPCSFSVARTERELADPALRREVGRVTPSGGTYLADEAYFSRPGPRLAAGVRLIAQLLRLSVVAPPLPVSRWGTRGEEAAT